MASPLEPLDRLQPQIAELTEIANKTTSYYFDADRVKDKIERALQGLEQISRGCCTLCGAPSGTPAADR